MTASGRELQGSSSSAPGRSSASSMSPHIGLTYSFRLTHTSVVGPTLRYSRNVHRCAWGICRKGNVRGQVGRQTPMQLSEAQQQFILDSWHSFCLLPRNPSGGTFCIRRKQPFSPIVTLTTSLVLVYGGSRARPGEHHSATRRVPLPAAQT